LRELSLRWAEEDKDLAPEDARRWLGEAHERLVVLLEALAPERWDDVVIGCMEALRFPYREHFVSGRADPEPPTHDAE
jgi:hypothetical protein